MNTHALNFDFLAQSNRIHIVWFENLNVWNFKKKQDFTENLPLDWIVARIGDLVEQVTERVKVEAETVYKMVGVRWYGEGIFHRETVKGKDISATYLTPIKPNAFIYNRLFAWKQSFAVVPEDFTDYFVSNEFPQFIVDETKALPLYLYLCFMSSSLTEAVNKASIGSAAVSRNRFKEEYFLNFEVPLPPVETQRSIVEHWQKSREEIKDIFEKISQKTTEIDEHFFSDLGLPNIAKADASKSLTIWWKDFDRWSVSFNQEAQFGYDITKGSFPVISLNSILNLVQYGTSAKANNDATGIAVIRMNNLINGTLDLSNLKYIFLSDKEKEKLLLKTGDILFNRTNSKELVGKCAVFQIEGEYIFASYLIRVRTNPDIALPEFVVFSLNSQIGRRQIDATSRQIIGQANINSQELRSLQIPLPPIEIQREIINRVEKGRDEITAMRQSAKEKAKAIETEIEELILGVKPL
jgi:type I restriction enzyme S subunit